MEGCRICGDVSLGIQFGVQACSACASFFRRTITEVKEYKCWENEQCEPVPGIRNSCRSCRLKRCLELGMKENKVQRKRDKNSTIVIANSTAILAKPKDLPCTSASSDILGRIGKRFDDYLIGERAIFITRRPELAVLTDDEMIVIPVKERLELGILTFPIVYTMMRENILDFAEVEKKVKYKLFDAFLCRFKQLVRVWFTAQKFVRTKQLHKCAMSAMDYVDTSRPELFYGEDFEVHKIFRPYAKAHQKVAKKAYAMRLDKTEFAALIGLTTVNIVRNLMDSDKVEEQLQKILNELKEHVAKRHKNVSKRMGHIIMLLREIETTTSLLNECFFLAVVVSDTYRQVLDRLGEICSYLCE
ncbi:unnamed protein product [Bursaphelenchus xylophilus]|nr:unnamed protein product [Bursaphelenchus xylophilus]CAG9114371.1 unnamed protein product [Bursaphelenchus xylophilus]